MSWIAHAWLACGFKHDLLFIKFKMITIDNPNLFIQSLHTRNKLGSTKRLRYTMIFGQCIWTTRAGKTMVLWAIKTWWWWMVVVKKMLFLAMFHGKPRLQGSDLFRCVALRSMASPWSMIQARWSMIATTRGDGTWVTVWSPDKSDKWCHAVLGPWFADGLARKAMKTTLLKAISRTKMIQDAPWFTEIKMITELP